MEKVTLVCTSLNPDTVLLNKMIVSAEAFDIKIVHIDSHYIRIFENDFPSASAIIWEHLEHLKIEEAYNLIIQNYVTTEWVCCFCDDDYFYPEGLSKMIAEVHKGIDADVAHFKFHVSGYMPKEDIRGQYHKVFGNGEYDLCEKQRITVDLLDKHNRLPAGSFFRKTAWEKAGGFQGDKCHDWDLWKRMAEVGCKFKFFDVMAYNMVRRSNSAWIRQNAKR